MQSFLKGPSRALLLQRSRTIRSIASRLSDEDPIRRLPWLLSVPFAASFAWSRSARQVVESELQYL